MYNPFDSSAGFGRKFIEWLNGLVKNLGLDFNRVDRDIREVNKKVEDINAKAEHFDNVDEMLVQHNQKLTELEAGSQDNEVILARHGYPSLSAFLESLASNTSEYSIRTGHKHGHEKGGFDEIDVYNLKNGDIVEQTTTRLDDLAVSVRLYDYVGDGKVDETSIFDKIERDYSGRVVDLAGGTFLVETFPRNNKYVNGFFVVKNQSSIPRGAGFVDVIQAGNSNVIIGRDAAKNYMPGDQYSNDGTGHNIIAIGDGAMPKASKNSKNNLALGVRALTENEYGFYNIAIGLEAQRYGDGIPGDKYAGTRNVSMGDNTLRFNKNGYANVVMGRDALQTAILSIFNTALGPGAMSGEAPLDLDKKTIINLTPTNVRSHVAIGTNASQYINSDEGVAVGFQAGREVKMGGRNTAIGAYAMENMERPMTVDGFLRTFFATKTGSYTWMNNALTVTMVGHGLQVGYTAKLKIDDNELQYFKVVSVSGDTFTVNTRVSTSVTKTGIATMGEYYQPIAVSPSSDNVAVGIKAMQNATSGNFNTALGGFALLEGTGDGNTSVGYQSMKAFKVGEFNTAIGYNAMRFDFTGAELTNVSKSTAIGYNSRVSGSKQLQLGDTDVSVYAFGAIQNRSDARDKADVEDTKLGLNLTRKLRPVGFKWDIRDDYVIYNEDDTVTILPKDGSKKRERIHQGFIAQEVEAVMKELGLEFGGLQDHSVNGGGDVYSIGYEEFIGPIVRSIQELADQADVLEEQDSTFKTLFSSQQEQMDGLRKDMNKLNQSHLELIQSLDASQKDNQTLKAGNEELKQTVTSLQELVTTLQQDINELKNA
ncbi:tail fiber domain-containing protein [Priestia megaterium]|uniref:tail fiber domain-containing protein n=1 Tax=Priestia megaterium TaxID=1404 RepID=UPI003009BEDC